ncbi:MAG: patched family protein [Bacteroidetes bacterium]|nr:MAG: patched family protein [Bacteroidota bacterium]
MWAVLSRIILRNRTVFLIALGLITVFFAWRASKIEQSYSYARALPTEDQAYIDYEKLKELYGEDGSVMVLGFSDADFYTLKKFNGWYDLGEKIKALEGIQDVLSVATLYNMKRNDSLNRFDFIPLLKQKPSTQKELDSIKQVILSLPFYEGLIFNSDSNATLMAITFDKSHLNSKKRISMAEDIQKMGDEFAKGNGIDLHYSGMPYIRTVFMKKVSSEMILFLVLAVVVTAVILFLFFRSYLAVFFSVVVCLVGVVISVGTLELFGFKITILSGLIPPLILVIGVPNCIFIINKYQEELVRHGNKIKALSRALQKVAMSNFLANITTAIGFGVFYFTNSSLLVEFGIVAAINVMSTYAISHILLPIIYSFLPAPAPKYTKHLNNKYIARLMEAVDDLVHKKRKAIYWTITAVTLVSIYGMTKINVNGYLVDDLPKKDPIYQHLHFFEHNFHGVMPFEVNVDTKKANGIFADRNGSAGATLYKIQSLQRMIKKYEAFSKPVSIVEGLKFAYQAYSDGDPKKYKVLPGAMDLAKLRDYTQTVKGKENKLAAFMDSTKRYTRISYQMADVGTDSLQKLISEIRPRVDSIFNYDREENVWAPDSLKYDVALTGLSHVFLKSNAYLFHHLFVSLLIAIGLILIIGIALFRSIPIIVLSKLPCLIPLAITAGIMGFAGIPFKPSTILIFSIAFGIASDGTIYILTEYRHQLRRLHEDRSQAISRTVRELGTSMIYTNIILFFGFAIFAASTFGGTVAMGILISITLLVSLTTNLLLLPSILLSLEKRIATKDILEKPFLDVEEEEEDEEESGSKQ